MIVQQLRLQGVRSWEEGEINLEEGFTTIIGPKGAGKSSIIFGLEFALFGDEAYPKYTGIMREGASFSEVNLVLQDQGRVYIITRGLIRTGDTIAQDPSKLSVTVGGALYTRNKATDLNRDIKSLLKIDRRLLEYTCLARQEELKKLLNMDPSDRKEIVDELLQLDAFDIAWESLGKIAAGEEGYLKRLKEETAKYDLEALSKQYNQLVQQLDVDKKEYAELEEKLATEKAKLEGLRQDVEKLDRDARAHSEMRKQVEEKQKQLAEEKGKLQRASGEIATYQQMLEKSEEEEDQLAEQISGLWSDAEEAGYDKGLNIDVLRTWIAGLNEFIEKLTTTISIDQRAFNDESKREQELQGVENCPYCGQLLTSHKTEQFRRERIERINSLRKEILENQQTLEEIVRKRDSCQKAYNNLDKLLDRFKRLQGQMEDTQENIDGLQETIRKTQSIIGEIEGQIRSLEVSLPPYAEESHNKKRKEWIDQISVVHAIEEEITVFQTKIENSGNIINDLSAKIQEGQRANERAETYSKLVGDLHIIRRGCRVVLPELRMLYLRTIQSYVQRTYNDINSTSTFLIEIDQNYTPQVKTGGYTRSYNDISGGERTEIALAYRIGLGNAIYEARTGSPMELLILDEPTENLGNEEEDRSIERLAQTLANLKVRQIITITHDQTFARFADQTIQIRKINEKSRVV